MRMNQAEKRLLNHVGLDAMVMKLSPSSVGIGNPLQFIVRETRFFEYVENEICLPGNVRIDVVRELLRQSLLQIAIRHHLVRM